MTIHLDNLTPEQLEEKKQTILNCATYGLDVKAASDIVGLSSQGINALLRQDPNFKTQFDKARTESVRSISEKMHQMALKGSVPAMTFLLANDKKSPYRKTDADVSAEEQETVNMLLKILAEQSDSLLPILRICPHCGKDYTQSAELSNATS